MTPWSRLAAPAIFALVTTTAPVAQDLSTFLSHPPAPGASASYRIETASPGRVKTERFNLAVTGAETVGGVPHVWLEAGPTDFATFKDGYLRLLLKANPTPEEALNPFLEAAVLAFQEPGSAPFKLSGGALSFMHNQAKKIKVEQKKEEMPPDKATTTKGATLQCKRLRISTTTESSLFGRDVKVTESGVYWFSDQTPFQLVKAEIDRLQVQEGKEDRRRKITVTLREGADTGAASQYTVLPVTREKGLLGILLH